MYRVFFLSDNFETLITLSILKISSFCKVVLTNQTGTFDYQQKRSSKRYYNIHFKQLESKVLFLENRSMETHLDTVHYENANNWPMEMAELQL